MPRPERPLDPAGGVIPEFAARLRRLRDEAGSPGYRKLAGLAHYSATTLSDAAGGRRMPSLAVTLAYVRACGGNTTEWEVRWRAAAARLSELDGRPAAGQPPDSPPASDNALQLTASWTVQVATVPQLNALVTSVGTILDVLRDAYPDARPRVWVSPSPRPA